jgi:hypothetical protein
MSSEPIDTAKLQTMKTMKPIPLNDEIMKGIWIDGFAVYIGDDYAVLDGIIMPPRAEKPAVAARLMFPTRILGDVASYLGQAAKERAEAMKKKEQAVPK